MKTRHAVVFVCLAGCSCASSHTRDDAAMRRDGSVDGDASPLADSGPRECLPREDVGRITPWIPMAHCTEDVRRSCGAMARAFGGPRALSTCVEDLPTCSTGVTCTSGPAGESCSCGGAGDCVADEECIAVESTVRCDRVCLSPADDGPSWGCMPDPPAVLQANLSSIPCGEQATTLCNAWAQAFAATGMAVTACATNDVLQTFCGHGDACVARGESDVLECTCGGTTCAPNEICVRGGAGEAPRCALACFPAAV